MRISRAVAPQQLSFVTAPVRTHSRLRERLRSLDIQQLTPLAALNLLAELQDEAQREES
jgi:cell division protein ZapA (FtsZ GTPase activity inhibitor)